MYNKTQREIYNLDRSIACERLGIRLDQYNWFRRKGQVLRRLYEDYCNGIESEETEREEQVTTDAIMAQAKEVGLRVFLQTDPRGAVVYLRHEPIESNNDNRPGSYCIC